jgi:aspartokinase/homoserine dehydrogenase 1
VADAPCFRRVAEILESQAAGPLGVVLSACKGVTDALLNLVTLAEGQDEGFQGELDALRARHARIAESLLQPESVRLYLAAFDRDRHDIAGVLHTVKLTRSAARSVSDLIAGYGEIWSTRLFREFFEHRAGRQGSVQWVDARQVVVVEWGPLGPIVQWEASRRHLGQVVPAGFAGTLIITGFIAADARGVQTTLGRNGSDFSGYRMPRSSIRCPTTRRWSSRISAPRSFTRRPWPPPSVAVSRSGSAIPSRRSVRARSSARSRPRPCR